jgi:hypothetical protein
MVLKTTTIVRLQGKPPFRIGAPPVSGKPGTIVWAGSGVAVGGVVGGVAVGAATVGAAVGGVVVAVAVGSIGVTVIVAVGAIVTVGVIVGGAAQIGPTMAFESNVT